MDYTNQVKTQIIDWGADLVGIADVALLKGLKTNPLDLLEPFTRAIPMAVHIPVSVFEMIKDQPTPIYASAYKAVNRLLDDLALRLSRKLQDDGYLSFPVPASQIVDKKDWYGAISHKAVARMAGLGWQGKNLLLITPQYGSRVRLVTLLPFSMETSVSRSCCNGI